jgi:hypothetical protein
MRSIHVSHATGFPLDDAWIHVRFAQNLARNGSFAFNPGEPTAGSTSPLWVVMLAGASFFSGEFVFTALSLGVLTYLLLGLSTYLVARKMFGESGPAIVAALVVLVNVRVAWAALSGMETCAAALLALVASASFAADEATRLSKISPQPSAVSGQPSAIENRKSKIENARLLLTPVLFGLASLARPEAHLLFCLAVFLQMARSCRRDTPIRDLIRIIPFRMIAIYLLVVLPWHLFSLWSSGSLLPNTFRANYRGLATRYIPAGFYAMYARWLFIRDHPWVYWLVPIGVLATIGWTLTGRPNQNRPANRIQPYALALAQLSSLWVVCYPPASRTILPMTRHHMRYSIPMTPFHAILAVFGIWALVILLGSAIRWLQELGKEEGQPPAVPNERRSATILWFAVSAAVVISALPGLSRWTTVHGRNVFSINHQHVAMAEWIKRNTPPDAVIAAHDIGALGAVSQRRIVDIFGLVTPAMIHRVTQIIPTLGSETGWYLPRIRDCRATYLVGYPAWLNFVQEAPRAFNEVHRTVLDDVDICGGTDLVAYRIVRGRLMRSAPRP